MTGKANLQAAHEARADEFYTLYGDVDDELGRIPAEWWNGKSVYCNCDRHDRSNFVKWFADNFGRLGLRRLVATNFDPGFSGGLFDESDPDAWRFEMESPGMSSAGRLCGNGDFRSDECLEDLRRCDVVVTNPPFSLFRDFVSLVLGEGREMIALGGQNAITYREVYSRIMDGSLRVDRFLSNIAFEVPESYGGRSCRCWTENGVTYRSLGNICWWTSAGVPCGRSGVELTKRLSDMEYARYDNCDAINVDRVADIPMDWDGLVGVPITFLGRHDPEQFEIVRFRVGDDGRDLSVNGRTPYFRILVRRKK